MSVMNISPLVKAEFTSDWVTILGTVSAAYYSWAVCLALMLYFPDSLITWW